MLKAINENRLFKLLPYFFEHPSSVFVEIAQNAQRSGATKLDIQLKDGLLVATDNGKGTDNPAPLFVLADSDWTDEVEENQRPAGWGLFFLYSIADQVTFCSMFGSITFDCNAYLKQPYYRENVLDKVQVGYKQPVGFTVSAVLKTDIESKLDAESLKDMLAWFPLDITLNGKAVKRKTLQGEFEDYEIKTEYEGNTVYIQPTELARVKFQSSDSIDALKDQTSVIWYGIPIFNSDNYWRQAIVLDVTSGAPLTPVLPYRHSIKNDEKFAAFAKFVRDTAAEYCIRQTNKSKVARIALMRVLENIGTQEELDSLNKFHYESCEPYYQEDSCSEDSIDTVVKKTDKPPVNEILVITVDGEVCDTDDVVLPQGIIETVRLPRSRPYWLKTNDKEVVVEIKTNDLKPHASVFKWHNASIESKKGIKVVGVVSHWGNGDIYYAKDPDEFLDISCAVFAQKIYNEDGDSWDSQQDYFDGEVRKDIQKIKSAFDINDLIGGLHDVGILPHEVLSISVDRKKKAMTIVTKSKGKTDEKTIRLSA